MSIYKKRLFSALDANDYVVAMLNSILDSDLEPKKETDFELDLPFAGLKADEISVEVEENVLKISTVLEEPKGYAAYHKNKLYKYRLTERHDLEKLSAKFENGLLSIRIPLKDKPEKTVVKINLK